MSVIPVSSSVSSTENGFGYSEPIMSMSSRTVRSRSTAPLCSIAPIAPAWIAFSGVIPNRVTVPASGRSRPSSMSIVVDLPAPLGPSSATVSPGAMSMSMPSTARTGPSGLLKVLLRPRSAMPAVVRAVRPVRSVVMIRTLPDVDAARQVASTALWDDIRQVADPLSIGFLA